MPHLDIKTIYHLQLTTEEFKLIGLALCGRITDAEKQSALDLNLKLQELRGSQTQMIYDASKNTLTRAKEALTEYEESKKDPLKTLGQS
jgi:hypothetical protein